MTAGYALPTIRLADVFPGKGDLKAFAALLVVYWALTAAALQTVVAPGVGAAILPSAGVGFAFLATAGVRLWPAIFLARLLAGLTITAPYPILTTLLVSATTTIGAVVPVILINRSGKLDPRLNSLHDMARLVVIGAVVGGLISALLAGFVFGGVFGPFAETLRMLTAWGMGICSGILIVAPLLMVWSVPESWRFTRAEAWHLACCLIALTAVVVIVFLGAPSQNAVRTWHIFPMLVWAALAFNVRGASLALLISAGVALTTAILGVGPLGRVSSDLADRLMTAQQFVIASAVTTLVLAAVADERRMRAELARREALLRVETAALETLNRIGQEIASELDVDSLVHRVTEAGVELTHAKYGAFFYNVVNEQGEAMLLYALAGAPQSAFADFPAPRNTPLFEPTFSGAAVVRSGDVHEDVRYGLNTPNHGMPMGHLPVRSYLAVPVRLRSGEIAGSLLFGHPEPDQFDERAERLARGVAAQAAVALDNARLFQAAQSEIAERTRAEQHQRLLVHELNHRVKNTLATVQSIAAQTARSRDLQTGYENFTNRLVALSRAHDVLTQQRWEGASLRAIVEGALQPFETAPGERFEIDGPEVWMAPQRALALAMALHELSTNASKYGALSQAGGRVRLAWRRTGTDRLTMTWREDGGPPVSPPTHKGFGTRLLERGLAGELGGNVVVEYRPEGLTCTIEAHAAETAEAVCAGVMQL